MPKTSRPAIDRLADPNPYPTRELTDLQTLIDPQRFDRPTAVLSHHRGDDWAPSILATASAHCDW